VAVKSGNSVSLKNRRTSESFERNILRRIFGPVRGREWDVVIKYNEEL
jgi:ribosomal protein L28